MYPPVRAIRNAAPSGYERSCPSRGGAPGISVVSPGRLATDGYRLLPRVNRSGDVGGHGAGVYATRGYVPHPTRCGRNHRIDGVPWYFRMHSPVFSGCRICVSNPAYSPGKSRRTQERTSFRHAASVRHRCLQRGRSHESGIPIALIPKRGGNVKSHPTTVSRSRRCASVLSGTGHEEKRGRWLPIRRTKRMAMVGRVYADAPDWQWGWR